MFVLCGAYGLAQASMVWSVNPSLNDLTAGSGQLFTDTCKAVDVKNDPFSPVSGVAGG
jgi:hypothetical protein